jgi:hypothetical protein
MDDVLTKILCHGYETLELTTFNDVNYVIPSLEEKKTADGFQNCQCAVTRTTRENMKNMLSVRWQCYLHEEHVQIHLICMLECTAIHMDIMANMVTQFGIITTHHKV